MRSDVAATAPAQRTPEPVTGPRLVTRMARQAELRLRPTVYIPSPALRIPITRTHAA